MQAELSPVTDFSEACCRQFSDGECTRAGFCNFMHAKKPTRALLRGLMASQKAMIKARREEAARAKEAARAAEAEPAKTETTQVAA